jgi:hypothetical protein
MLSWLGTCGAGGADLAGSEGSAMAHAAEAVQYRTLATEGMRLGVGCRTAAAAHFQHHPAPPELPLQLVSSLLLPFGRACGRGYRLCGTRKPTRLFTMLPARWVRPWGQPTRKTVTS